MQWLAQICVRRPVFASVLMLRHRGARRRRLRQARPRSVPQRRLPLRRRDHAPRRRRAGGGRDRHHRQDRGRGQHHQRHRRAALDVDPGRLAASSSSSSWRRTATSPRRTCATRSRPSCHDLPKGIDPPIVSKIDLGAAPILLIAVRSDKPIREVTEIADKQVRRQIESIDGVGQVQPRRRRKPADQRLARPASRCAPRGSPRPTCSAPSARRT